MAGFYVLASQFVSMTIYTIDGYPLSLGFVMSVILAVTVLVWMFERLGWL